MDLNKLIRQVEKFTVDNSPTILTALGVTGTITTAYLTGKASFKAAETISKEQFKINLHELKSHELTFKEKTKLVWTYYIPPTVAGAGTVAAVVCANRISSKRAAAMAAAYSISEKAFSEYKEKVVEKLGEKKEQAARDEIAQQKVDANPPGSAQVIVTGGGEVLFLDKYTGRYFYSSMETVKSAENEVNFRVLHNDYATLNDFYQQIGLSAAPVGEEVGWAADQGLYLNYSTTISDDKKPCIVIDYVVMPIRKRA